MTTLHIVTTQIGGYAREDSTTTSVIGVYTDPEVAKAVKTVCGSSASISIIELDHVPPGLAQAMAHYGISLLK